MAIRILFIGSPFDAAQTPELLFRALGIEDVEERDSDNYPQGFYHVGRAGDVEVTLWSDEYDGFEGYPFQLSIDVGDETGLNINEITDLAISELLGGRFQVAEEMGHGNGVVERELYSLDRYSNLLRTRDTRPYTED